MLSPDAPSLVQAAQRLRLARLELRDGRYEHCVATCRRVLENLTHLRPVPSFKEIIQTHAEQRTQAERWAALHYDLPSLSSAAHHDDEVTKGFTWTRVDAEAVLAATAGLLARLRR